ncbi:MAG: hypothetical protein BGO67_09825 [Alphaproteobacteria bacterium 41-28]|nr:MAG: hypothetical protein BGO67_09825 [Alphaproteobacteria bacterium 41-28]
MNNKNTLFVLPFFMIAIIFLSNPPDVFAVQEGQMKESVNNLRALLGGNVIAAVLTAGVVAGAIFSYMKSSFVPFGTSIGIAIGYAFANKWIEAAYTCCI